MNGAPSYYALFELQPRAPIDEAELIGMKKKTDWPAQDAVILPEANHQENRPEVELFARPWLGISCLFDSCTFLGTQ